MVRFSFLLLYVKKKPAINRGLQTGLWCSAVAQLVEQETVNLLVTGSSPVRGANPFLPFYLSSLSSYF